MLLKEQKWSLYHTGVSCLNVWTNHHLRCRKMQELGSWIHGRPVFTKVNVIYHHSGCRVTSFLLTHVACQIVAILTPGLKWLLHAVSICHLALEECHPFAAMISFQVVTYHAQSCAITGKRNAPTPGCSYFKARLKFLKLGSWTDTTDGAGFCKSHIFISFDSSRISHLVHLYSQWIWETAS